MKDKENNAYEPPTSTSARFKTGGQVPPICFLELCQIGDEEKCFAKSPQVPEV